MGTVRVARGGPGSLRRGREQHSRQGAEDLLGVLVADRAVQVVAEEQGRDAVGRGPGGDLVEALVSFTAVGAASVQRFESRGWSAEEWSAARERLVARGPVTESGTATPAGRDLRAEVERRTDRLAAAPREVLAAAADRVRLVEPLGEFWVVVPGSGPLPSESTLGIGRV